LIRFWISREQAYRTVKQLTLSIEAVLAMSGRVTMLGIMALRIEKQLQPWFLCGISKIVTPYFFSTVFANQPDTIRNLCPRKRL